MSVIFGVAGRTQDAALAAMSEALGQRARDARARDQGPYGALAFGRSPHSPASRLEGLWRDPQGDRALVLAGHLVAPWPALLERGLSALMDALERDPQAALERLSGAWTLAWRVGPDWGVARDGAGHRALYYTRHQGLLIFGAEPKAVLAHPGVPRALEYGSLARYMAFSYCPGERTMVRDLLTLKPGHWIRWQVGQADWPVQRRHFDFERDEPEVFDDDHDWPARLRERLAQAIHDRSPPEAEPVAVFLSGGVDSSAVTAQLSRQRSSPVRTFSIHFGPDHPHELDFARAVAKRCGSIHEEVLIRPRDFVPRLRQIIWALDEPIGDPITAPNFELSRHVAAQGIRHVFNGEGGDPCFGGPKNLTMMLHHWYGGVDQGPGARERAYLASYRRAYEELRLVLTPEALAQIDEARDLEAVLTPFFEASRPRQFLHKLLAINIRLKGGHLILPKVERMYSASGLIPHSPLFDEGIIRLAFQMPGTMKVSRGVEKQVLKRAYADALPREVIERPKSGMRVPVHAWLSEEMARYARHVLSASELRRAGLFDPARVKQLLRYETVEGPGRYGLRLWMLLTFELWRRMTLEGERP